VRAVIRRLDAHLRRANGVFEFCQDPGCLLRLQLTNAPHQLNLSGFQVNKREPVLVLHLWNEHLPPIPPSGPTLSWAVRFERLLIQSFQAVASWLYKDPRSTGIRAVGGVLALLPSKDNSGGVRLMQRLGFTILPYHNPLGRFGEFWENFYSWSLLWSYNPASLRSHKLFQLRRREIWMAKDQLIKLTCYNSSGKRISA
jgi:hypothetical protein